MKFRMYYDYLVYIALLKRKESFILLVDLVSFLIATYGSIAQWTQEAEHTRINVYFILFMVLSIIKLGWDTYKTISDIKSYRQSGKFEVQTRPKVIIGESFVDISTIKPSRLEESQGFVRINISNHDEVVLNSPKFDQLLMKTELGIRIDNAKEHKIKKLIESDKDILIPFLNEQFCYSLYQNKGFFNEKKLCLSEDISMTDDVVCHRGCYYDSFLTNQICTQQLLSKETNKLIYDGTRYFPVDYHNNEVRLSEFSTSYMNNHIGVSTLGITSDNFLVIWKQNAHAQFNNNFHVPTGSGSCDWNDYVENSFIQTLITGMQRELREENRLRIKDNVSMQTKVIGYFRWVNRGGKPEFVGVTKINTKASHLEPNHLEVRQSNSSGHLYRVRTLDELRDQIQKIRLNETISTPLFMCLQCLEHYIEESPDDVKLLLNIN